MTHKIVSSLKFKKASSQKGVLVTLPAKDYLFAQASICTSVLLERNTHLITPDTSKFVNNNGDAWSNESLKANYETYIGAFNFVNHVQIPEKSVGFIADAILRRRYLDKDASIFVYYVDILIATHRDNAELVRKISTNDIQFLSMGCTAHKIQCSRCGYLPDPENEDDLCEHLFLSKGLNYIDSKGVRRITAELLGSADQYSCVFDEASWLTQPPASEAAVKRNLLPIDPASSVQITLPEWAMERPALKMYLKE